MTTTNAPLTPMLRQYQELKRQHPGTLLFFRLGDFYELFFDDAVTGARELEITLTARHKERGTAIPMCGVPHHAVANYVARLIRKGYRVAICEQTEDPSKAKKLVRREVVRVITPGTAIDPHLVEAKETVYLAALSGAGDTFGAAFLDLSTGEFRATETTGPDAWARVRADIESYAPRELLFPASLTLLVKDAYAGRGSHTAPLPLGEDAGGAPVARITPADAAVGTPDGGVALTPLDDWLWEPTSCATLLLEQFGARTLEGYGLANKVAAVSAAGACLRYARETQRAAAAHVTDLSFFEAHATSNSSSRRAARAAARRSSASSTRPSRAWARGCSARGCCGRPCGAARSRRVTPPSAISTARRCAATASARCSRRSPTSND
jgi:DNA mismatch repair protein MutS